MARLQNRGKLHAPTAYHCWRASMKSSFLCLYCTAACRSFNSACEQLVRFQARRRGDARLRALGARESRGGWAILLHRRLLTDIPTHHQPWKCDTSRRHALWEDARNSTRESWDYYLVGVDVRRWTIRVTIRGVRSLPRAKAPVCCTEYQAKGGRIDPRRACDPRRRFQSMSPTSPTCLDVSVRCRGHRRPCNTVAGCLNREEGSQQLRSKPLISQCGRLHLVSCFTCSKC